MQKEHVLHTFKYLIENNDCYSLNVLHFVLYSYTTYSYQLHNSPARRQKARFLSTGTKDRACMVVGHSLPVDQHPSVLFLLDTRSLLHAHPYPTCDNQSVSEHHQMSLGDRFITSETMARKKENLLFHKLGETEVTDLLHHTSLLNDL